MDGGQQPVPARGDYPAEEEPLRLMAPCRSVAIKTLLRVRRWTHVNTAEQATVRGTNAEEGPATNNTARCHATHSAPRIRLAESADLPASSLGSA